MAIDIVLGPMLEHDNGLAIATMGSLATEPEVSRDEKELNVLVTGFGVRSPLPIAIVTSLISVW